jgi:hypothetical protein
MLANIFIIIDPNFLVLINFFHLFIIIFLTEIQTLDLDDFRNCPKWLPALVIVATNHYLNIPNFVNFSFWGLTPGNLEHRPETVN